MIFNLKAGAECVYILCGVSTDRYYGDYSLLTCVIVAILKMSGDS